MPPSIAKYPSKHLWCEKTHQEGKTTALTETTYKDFFVVSSMKFRGVMIHHTNYSLNLLFDMLVISSVRISWVEVSDVEPSINFLVIFRCYSPFRCSWKHYPEIIKDFKLKGFDNFSEIKLTRFIKTM